MNLVFWRTKDLHSSPGWFRQPPGATLTLETTFSTYLHHLALSKKANRPHLGMKLLKISSVLWRQNSWNPTSLDHWYWIMHILHVNYLRCFTVTVLNWRFNEAEQGPRMWRDGKGSALEGIGAQKSCFRNSVSLSGTPGWREGDSASWQLAWGVA